MKEKFMKLGYNEQEAEIMALRTEAMIYSCPPEKKADLKSCVKQVIAQGKSKERAHAICNAQLEISKSENELGRMGREGLGQGGSCVCPKCGYKTTHTTGKPCDEIKCSKCGVMLIRKK